MSDKKGQEGHIFFVDTRFQRMARRPGGLTREDALARAHAQVDQLKPDFSGWLDREMQELSAALSQIEGNCTDALALDRAYLSCSQLRDVGTTMGFALVTLVANNLCDILDAIKAGTDYDKDMIDCHLNALILARTDAYRNLRPEQVPEMTSGLRRVVELASNPSTRKSK